MSGHSKWSTIRHKKAANDAKKGKIFSKLSSQITIAARDSGGDLDMNPLLRMYVDKAKEAGFPIDKIQKAIEKGTGEGGNGVKLENISYEGYGPNGIQIIVDVLTDNKNRTVSDIRQVFTDIGGSMGDEGSVAWNFDTKGLVVIKPGHMEKSPKYGEPDIFVAEDIDEVMMNIMDIDGVVDIESEEDELEVFTEYQDFAKVRNEILRLGYVLDDAKLIKVPKMEKSISDSDMEKAQSAIEKIEELEDVQDVWTDIGV